jgi:hypothetical protein
MFLLVGPFLRPYKDHPLLLIPKAFVSCVY